MNCLNGENNISQSQNVDVSHLSSCADNLNLRIQKNLHRDESIPNTLETHENMNLNDFDDLSNINYVDSINRSEAHHIEALFLFDNPNLQEQANREMICSSSDDSRVNDTGIIIENMNEVENFNLQGIQSEQTHRLVSIT